MDEDGTAGRCEPELLLPAVRGTSGGSSEREHKISKTETTDEAGDEEEDEENGDDHNYDGPALSLRSHTTFSSLPSFMRAKSGLEMDPDRFRRRKQMISNLPAAASARKLMRGIATNWDPRRNGQLLGFDCVSLDPTQFKELFRRNFGVLLDARDLGILVSLYDKRGEGKADSADFLKDFWLMGREGRDVQSRKRAQMIRKLHAKQQTRLQERAERMSRLKEVAVGNPTEEDVRGALIKINEVAARYDTSRDKGFQQLGQGSVMGPTTFREQLRTVLGVRLTHGELGGLVSAFDLHREGMVDAKEFASRFHALGRERHAARAAQGAARNERARRRKQEKEEALLAKMREQSKCKINWDYSEEDLERGRALIAKAASTYDKGRLGADIDRIAQMRMDPTAFRAQLIQNFRVRLCPGELGAVFTEFDKDKSMLIDGTELMHEFFRLGRVERAKQLAEIEQQRQRVDKRERSFRRRLEDRFIEQTTAKVIWPVLPRDPFDETDYSMDEPCSMARQATPTNHGSCETPSLGSRSAGRPCSKDAHRGASRRRSRESNGEGGDGECGGLSARRGRPNLRISASTAEFLAQIDKEEMAIRSLTCRGRRQGQNNRSGREDGGSFSSASGLKRTASATAGAPAPAAPSWGENSRSYLRKNSSSAGKGGRSSDLRPPSNADGIQRRLSGGQYRTSGDSISGGDVNRAGPAPTTGDHESRETAEGKENASPTTASAFVQRAEGRTGDGGQGWSKGPPGERHAGTLPSSLVEKPKNSVILAVDATPSDQSSSGTLTTAGPWADGIGEHPGVSGGRVLESRGGESGSQITTARNMVTRGSSSRSSRGGESRASSFAEGLGSRGQTISEHSAVGDGVASNENERGLR